MDEKRDIRRKSSGDVVKKELARLWGLEYSRFHWKPGDIQPRPDVVFMRTKKKMKR